ncbi:tyrosine-type recombinase/integrase [Commensalibacter communis]
MTNLDDLQQMINIVTDRPARPLSKLASRLLALIGTRSGEFRQMRWDQIEGDVWTIPAEQMKMKQEYKLQNKRNHKVFLSKQALEILELIRPLSGNCLYVFPNSKDAFSYMSENTIGKLINTAGFKGQHTPHGFRTSLSTIMNERYPQDRAVIDLMLAHINPNAVEDAYNRSQHEAR